MTCEGPGRQRGVLLHSTKVRDVKALNQAFKVGSQKASKTLTPLMTQARSLQMVAGCIVVTQLKCWSKILGFAKAVHMFNLHVERSASLSLGNHDTALSLSL